MYTHNGYLYEANYAAGVRILKIDSGIGAIHEAAYFDTEPDFDSGTAHGAVWSVYPYFPSGTIVASSIYKGLFVLRAQPFPLSGIHCVSTDEKPMYLNATNNICEYCLPGWVCDGQNSTNCAPNIDDKGSVYVYYNKCRNCP